jgi:cytochrome b561
MGERRAVSRPEEAALEETMGDARLKYGPVAMGFHWLIAALILSNYVLAWIFNGHALFWDWGEMKGPMRILLTQWHKSIGVLVLVLSLLRLGWRLITPQPDFAVHLQAWERGLAHMVHWLFYVFMIGMPLVGWIMVSATTSTRYGVTPVTFLLFDWPQFPGFQGMSKEQLKAAHEIWESLHRVWFAWAGYVLIGLHVTGALKHQFFDKDNELARMVPFLGTPGRKGFL